MISRSSDRVPVKCASQAVIEPLESRQLLSAAFEAHISFQPANLPLTAGYVADAGAVFANRGNGLIYGWDADDSKNVKLHKTKLAPDLRYNTDALLLSGRKPGGHSWSIQVPNDIYTVHLVVGDGTAGWKSQVMANGISILEGKATTRQRWIDRTATITVTNGTIALTNGPKINSSRLAFVDIIGTAQSNEGGSSTPTGGGTTPANPPLATFAWSTKSSAPMGLAEAQSVVVGSKLYVFGGYNVTSPDYQPTSASESYDPATDTWTTLAPMPAAETHMAVATDGASIYVAGGYTFNPKTTYQTFGTTNVFKYDVAANTWTTIASLPAARGAGALVYLDGQLHFMDGVDTSRAGQTEHWVLNARDPSAQWTNSTAVPFSSNHTAAVVLDGKIYIVGGQSTSDDSSTIADVLRWDPANPSAWTAVASMPIRRSHAVVSVADNQIIVAGGTTGNDVPLDSVISYDPTKNSWSAQTSLPSPRLAPVGGVIGNQLIVATGVGSGQLQSQTWITSVT